MERKLPTWIVKRLSPPLSDDCRGKHKPYEVRNLLRSLALHTVCEGARCPNLYECFAESIATFMILGNTCTRSCGFCALAKGDPLPVDLEEPKRVARAVDILGLKHVVITSVSRDDLEDGGATQFSSTIKEVRLINPDAVIEVLIPDFGGSRKAIEQVLEEKPDIVGHNIETVPSLYRKVRPEASYEWSLALLRLVKVLKQDVYTKSGLMLGLGEEEGEILAVMEDLREIDCDILTIGQYLRPSKSHLEVCSFIPPNRFEEYRRTGEKMGFVFVASGPFVRSSFKASEFSRRFIRKSIVSA